MSGLSQGRLLGRMDEEAGDELIGQLLEGAVNLGLQLGESSGIVGELLGPALLLGGEMLVDLLQCLVRSGDVGAGLGVETAAHGQSFRFKLLLPGYNSGSGSHGHPFLGMDPCRLQTSRAPGHSLAG